MTYAEKLKDPRWQKKRLQIFERDNWTCQKCDDKDSTLHVHHLKYYKNPWDVDEKYLVTVCHDCHELIEVFKDDIKFVDLVVLKLRNKEGGHLLITNVISDSITFFQWDSNKYDIHLLDFADENNFKKLSKIVSNG